jgi:hypothetical protein
MSIKYIATDGASGLMILKCEKNERRIVSTFNSVKTKPFMIVDDSISLTISTTITELFSKLELEDRMISISRNIW